MGITGLGDRELEKKLPKTLVEMSRVIPLPAVLRIARRFGGTRLCFSRNPKANGKLARLVGLPAARALGQYYGGEQCDIPRADLARARRRANRNHKICRLIKEGVSAARVALRFKISRRHVGNIFNKETS